MTLNERIGSSSSGHLMPPSKTCRVQENLHLAKWLAKIFAKTPLNTTEQGYYFPQTDCMALLFKT